MPTKVYVACVREGGREATVTRAPHMSQRSTSVVVVPSGFLLRCLRKDMAISLVFERSGSWFPRALPPPSHTRAEGEEGSQEVNFGHSLNVTKINHGEAHSSPLHSYTM